jgi:exodeoxyribonuclease V alpha subunit
VTVRLHPRGAVVAALGESGRSDDVFRRLGVGARRCDLGDEGLYLAEELVDADAWIRDPTSRQALGYLILALMVSQRQGSTRLPLDPQGPLRKLIREIAALSGEELPGEVSPSADAIMRSIGNLTSGHFSSVIGLGQARLPLVVDDHALYTERALWLETRVAAALAARLREPRGLDDAERVVAQLVRAAHPASQPAGGEAGAGGGPGAAPTAAALTEEQRRAVAVALSSSVAIITGGPGTGKTAVAAAVVRGLVALGARSIALTAPTGKAAQRLGEVIASAFAEELAGGKLAATFTSGQTVHRLLGFSEEGYRHHAKSPLGVDAVVVDEASMLDLELMDALLDALPPRARLILIGDARQLPAVDAGQVMADLVGVGERVAKLTHSFRMDASDKRGAAVLAAARAIDEGDAKRLLEGQRRC